MDVQQPTPIGVTNSTYSLALRLKLRNIPGVLGRLTTTIGEIGGNIEAVDTVEVSPDFIIRDLTVNTASPAHGETIVSAIHHIGGVHLVNVSDRTFLMHSGGKIEVVPKTNLKTRADL